MGGGVFNSVAVSVDNVTCEIVAGLLQIKDAGVSAAKLAATALGDTWYLIEEKAFTAAATTYDFTPALSASAHNYRIIGNVNCNTDAQYILRLNGAAALGTANRIYQIGNAISSSTEAVCELGWSETNGKRAHFITDLSFTHLAKQYTGFNGMNRAADPYTSYIYSGDITTPNLAADISSIGVSSSSANGFQIGSVLQLWGRNI